MIETQREGDEESDDGCDKQYELRVSLAFYLNDYCLEVRKKERRKKEGKEKERKEGKKKERKKERKKDGTKCQAVAQR